MFIVSVFFDIDDFYKPLNHNGLGNSFVIPKSLLSYQSCRSVK